MFVYLYSLILLKIRTKLNLKKNYSSRFDVRSGTVIIFTMLKVSLDPSSQSLSGKKLGNFFAKTLTASSMNIAVPLYGCGPVFGIMNIEAGPFRIRNNRSISRFCPGFK